MHGLHLTADLRDCRTERAAMTDTAVRHLRTAGVRRRQIHAERFAL